jgi:HD domain
MTAYTDAICWASTLHGDAQRKHWPAPLLAHLVAVSSLVWEDGGDEEQAIGALLHDALVYGNCSLDDVEQRFGARVAQIARYASDTREVFEPAPRPPWLERRRSHIASICSLPMDVSLVMAADKAQECHEWSLQLALRPQACQSLPGGLEPLAWYYDALHTALQARLPGSRSLLILHQAVRALLSQLPESCAEPGWLSTYPQRHRADLFR